VSVTTSPPSPPGTVPTPAPVGETCPLCGAPLHPEQEWCLSCGAAARTRLATSPNWKTPIAVLAVVVALSLGVLAAALVKLAGGSGKAPAPLTTTVTTAATATTLVPTTTASTPSTLLPGAATHGTTSPATTLPRATTGAATTPSSGSTIPGATTSKTIPNLKTPSIVTTPKR
jgi:hypothetical protein